MAVGREVAGRISGACARLEIVGSVRRLRPEVGDVEILFIPRRGTVDVPGELFPREADLTDAGIAAMLRDGTLGLRRKKNGTTTFGPDIKLLVHRPTGIPVDLFRARESNWWCQLVCRTGGAANNERIATLAKQRGWKWNMNGGGFVKRDGSLHHRVASEEDVYEFVGIPYLRPEDRP